MVITSLWFKVLIFYRPTRQVLWSLFATHVSKIQQFQLLQTSKSLTFLPVRAFWYTGTFNHEKPLIKTHQTRLAKIYVTPSSFRNGVSNQTLKYVLNFQSGWYDKSVRSIRTHTLFRGRESIYCMCIKIMFCRLTKIFIIPIVPSNNSVRI